MKFIYTFSIAVIIASTSFAQNKKDYKPGQTFKDCPTCPEMVVIPAGSFTIGSPENEKGRIDKPEDGAIEEPQRLVHIRQFAAGRFHITKREWAAFVKETNRRDSGGCSWASLPGDTTQLWMLNPKANWNHVGFAQDSSHPVICINWNDADDYVHWLSKKTGFNYRLLSEAEWEYAAKAGSTTAFWWGEEASHEYENYGDSNYNATISGRDRWLGTSPVGSFPPNAFGLYDMNGNAMQWLADYFSISYQDLPTDGSPYKKDVILKMTGNRFAFMNNKSSSIFHIVRGGCFMDPPQMTRSSYRNWGNIPKSLDPDLSCSAGGGFSVLQELFKKMKDTVNKNVYIN